MSNISEDTKKYSYLVEISSEDNSYLAKCLELGIMAHGDSQEEAIQKIKEAVRVHLLMLLEDGEDIPEPKSIIVNL
ncbi:type II toxin-antitoxin system HicB family antitoxin [Crocosphaera sp. Alani8]|uniref:type II toxin-antitoxin system HicB family antitoxin n=1 Tax=Crocosphaera sp. Alani8 TaxID=3038952 RepID=UPI00313CDE8A